MNRPIAFHARPTILLVMGYCLTIFQMGLATAWSDLPEPVLEWSTPITLTGDGTPVAFPSRNPNGVVIAVPGRAARLDGGGQVLWDLAIGQEDQAGTYGTAHFDANVVDLDGDGRDEIIAGTGPSVYALEGDNGRARWRFDLGTPLDMFHFPVAAVFDAAQGPVILAPNLAGWLHALDAQGNLLWRHKLGPHQVSISAIGDVNGEGELDIVYGSDTHHLVALDRHGRLLWDTEVKGMHMGRSYPLITDADGDGRAEIYSLSAFRVLDSGLVAVDGVDGHVLWQVPMTHKAYCGLAAADLDGDGKQEILAADKGTALTCFSSKGELRWRRFLDGRGFFTRPAVADVDGDGHPEIIIVCRDQSSTGNSWYVLDAMGNVLGSIPLPGGGFATPLVADIDQDGVLEVVLTSRSTGRVSAYSFGGKVAPTSVQVSSWNQPPFHSPASVSRSSTMISRQQSFVLAAPTARFGRNPLSLQVPPTDHPQRLEIETTDPQASRHLRVHDLPSGSASFQTDWTAVLAGEYRLHLRVLNASAASSAWEQSLTLSLLDPLIDWKNDFQSFRSALESDCLHLENAAPDAAAGFRVRLVQIEYAVDQLSKRITAAATLSMLERDHLVQDTEQCSSEMNATKRAAELCLEHAAQGMQTAFLLWPDPNPWDNIDPMAELPASPLAEAPSLWALGNEIESAAFHVMGLSCQPLTLRLEPGTLTNLEDGTTRPADPHVDFRRAVRLPSRNGEIVPDLLPRLNEGFLLDAAPGQVQTLWLNVSTKNLPPGRYQFSWIVRTMEASPIQDTLTLNLEVSRVALPETSRYAIHFWSQNHLGDVDTIPDLNRTGQNVWYRMPMPSAQADAQGNLVGELDWQAHDAILHAARQVHRILYSSGAPVPRFPDGVQVTPELRVQAQKNYARALVEHLRGLGYDYSRFCFYPQDEPGLTGGVEPYIQMAKEIKSIDPKFQVYANPAGMITVEMIRAMEPYTDVWQPDIGTVKVLGESYIEAMRGPRGDKPVWIYTPPGNTRVVKPLGFFRAMAWQAFYWGIDGGGYWVYQSDDLWATAPEKEPGYGAVTFDGRAVVGSRRWEATRDGVEDYNLLALVRDAMRQKPDASLQALLDEAVSYMAETTLSDLPLESASYEPDFQRLQDYRRRLGKALEAIQAVQ